MLVTRDRAADLEAVAAVAAVAESRHRQKLLKYEMPDSERIARLELEVEARKMNLESEATATGHHVSSVSSALRESRPHHGQRQLDQANHAGNQFRNEVVELQDALDRAESKNANQREEFFSNLERRKPRLARYEEHANGIKKLTRLVESLQKQRVFLVDQHSYRSPTPPFASEPGTGPERQAPSHPAYEGGVHSPNFPEFYDMTGPIEIRLGHGRWVAPLLNPPSQNKCLGSLLQAFGRSWETWEAFGALSIASLALCFVDPACADVLAGNASQAQAV